MHEEHSKKLEGTAGSESMSHEALMLGIKSFHSIMIRQKLGSGQWYPGKLALWRGGGGGCGGGDGIQIGSICWFL